MRDSYVIANWKMNLDLGQLQEFAEKLTTSASNPTKVLVAPSSPFLAQAKAAFQGTQVGVSAQNVFFEKAGAFTGEISCEQLRSLNVDHVLIGHSERRHVFGESHEWIAKKVAACWESELNVVFCCGETQSERESGQTMAVLTEQLSSARFHKEGLSKLVIAYEPVWAIGTGKTATSDQAQEVHRFIRQWMGEAFGEAGSNISILYGGSVNEKVSASLFSQPDIDGGLVGGASLDPAHFASIIDSMGKASL